MPPDLASATKDAPLGASGRRGRAVRTRFIAIVSDGLEVTAYACDSAKISSWFHGLAAGGHPQLTGANGSRFDATLTKANASGTFVDAAGARHAFSAPRTRSTSLFRADATVAGKPLVGGWVLGSNGEHRGAINIGPNPNPSPAPNLNGLASPQLVTVDTGVRNTQVSASAVLPANTSISVPNTTGFGQFVLVGMGDSYSAGEGNPFKSANLPVNETVTAWDKLAAGAVLASPLLGLLTVGAPVLGLAAAIAAPAAAHAGGENLMPEVTGFGERSKEQWGGSADHPDAPANEGYRRLCHQGKSPSEKVFERLNADPKYRNVVQFVYYNFACRGLADAVRTRTTGRPRQGHDDHRGADPAAAAAAAGRVGRRVVHHGIGAHVPHDPTCSVVERPALR